MAIILPSGFNITSTDPVDSRITLATSASRYALAPANIYPGLTVYQQSTQQTFVLINTGSVANASGWQLLATAGANQFTGSQAISGSLTVTQGITGSLFGTASYALTASYFSGSVPNAISASYAQTASYVQNAQTASYVANAVSSSYALTASYVANASSFPYTGSAQITGSLGITGSLSILGTSGSSLAFNVPTDPTTGSLFVVNNTSGSSIFTVYANNLTAINGSTQITGSLTITQGITASLFGTASYALTASYVANAQTASYILNAVSASRATSAANADTASFVTLAQTASYATSASRATSAANADTASFVTLAQTASYVLQAVSSSYALTASYALNVPVTASYATSASRATSAANADTASFVQNAQTASYVQNAVSASYATTASYVNTLNQDVTISGSLTVNTTTGNAFNINADTFVFTGSINTTGSVSFAGLTAQSASYLVGYDPTTGNLYYEGTGSVVSVTSSYAVSASYAISASRAISASYANSVTGSSNLSSGSVTLWTGTAFANSSISENTGTVLISNAGGVTIQAGGLYVTGASTFHDNVLMQGNLTVQGTASFQNSTNLAIADQFILLNSGSTTFQDSGFVINTGNAGNSGSAFFLETAGTTTGSPLNGRFAVAGGVQPDATSVTAQEYANTTLISGSAPNGAVPQFGGTGLGQGNMWINTGNGDIYIYA